MKKQLKLALASTASAAGFLTGVSQVFAEEIRVQAGFFTDIGGLINKILTLVMAIGALLVFLYLIWGGIDWITSGGDKSKTEGARNKITAAIIGLIVLAAAWAILTIVLNFLNIKDLNDALGGAGLV